MKKIIYVIAVFTFFGCTDAQQSAVTGLGKKFKVELVNCDGSVSKSWISSGVVSSQEKSDGYFFKDDNTGKLIVISGTIVITEL